ncbi:MAG: hypothetical protein KKB50_04085 [Planctomycetes bacterium]|nr:hypothetical protein [Planctomycetota bacterium]
MSVNAGLGKLRHAGKDLRLQWNQTKAAWSDENSRRFEQNHLAPLLARLRTTELTLGQMATILQKLRRDCE